MRDGILDPQGKAVLQSLHTLGYSTVEDVRIGKYIELNIEDTPEQELDAKVKEMCSKLLANPIIEDFRYEVVK
ncbi:MAG: phosphoribosylformylglycinamidine synthase subunit PurS [Nitrospirae bacterium]|nr:phosphoribosylformylglycinamidine synthase subunit PurS [Nitrospirota bacterium]